MGWIRVESYRRWVHKVKSQESPDVAQIQINDERVFQCFDGCGIRKKRRKIRRKTFKEHGYDSMARNTQ